MTPRVLALSGGGSRGLVSLQALKYIEHRTGKAIHQLFDLVVGTSTGALQALALTSRIPMSAIDLEQAYLHLLSGIFDKQFWSLGGWTGPEYGSGALQAALQHVLGADPLSSCLVPTAVASYSLTARLPLLLTSYGAHRDMPAWEAARASSAAPTYFEPMGDMVDGGLVVNNPAMWAAIEAAELYGVNVEDCLVLSLGTGSTESPIPAKDAAGWGKTGWVSPALSICMDGGEDLVDLLMARLMGGRYLRLQTRLSGPVADMDNVTPANLLALRQVGQQVVGQRLTEVDAFIARLQA